MRYEAHSVHCCKPFAHLDTPVVAPALSVRKDVERPWPRRVSAKTPCLT
jgi:hypothetical protein